MMPNSRRKKYLSQYEEKKNRKNLIQRGNVDNCKTFGYIVPELSVSTTSKSFDPSNISGDQYTIEAHVPVIKSDSTVKKSNRNKGSPKLPRSTQNSPSPKRQNKDVTVTSSDIDLLMTNSNGYIEATSSYKLIELNNLESNSTRNRKSQNTSPDSTMRTLTLQNLQAISINGLKPVVQKVSKAILTSKSIMNIVEITCVAEFTQTHSIEFTQTHSIELQLSLDEETACYNDDVPSKHDDAVGSSSVQSMEDMCRICHGGEILSNELGALISACSCRGSVGRVHVKCLERWLTESGKNKCELCGVCYVTRRIHKYGVSKSLIMWLLSQNAKQLLVDSLGIMLMSPIAVLAAWLSGRTLAGLMAQEPRLLSWPLASTFVLACMTLVCYYCWIVSAATKHALDWWLWYRSQYEVKLQLRDEDKH